MKMIAGLALAATLYGTAQGASPEPLAPLDHGLRPTVLPFGAPSPRWSLAERMRHYRVPGVAVAVLRDGVVVASAGYGVRQSDRLERVDGQTLFSVGSVSKLATATTTLRLVAAGRLDLDRDVNGYLTRWRLPVPPAGDAKVSLRMLLSHTSGLGVHGFADYQPEEPLPSLVQVLDGVAPAKNPAVRFKWAPGAVNDYSGGGVTVEQMVLEDATGRSLADVAASEVFGPLGMHRTGFERTLPPERANIARAHGPDGRPRALPRGWEGFAEPGASGLWSSANDLGKLLSALIDSYQGRSSSLLPQALAATMMTEVSPGPFGLGPRLAGAGPSRRFFHLGANESYFAFVEGYLETGDGYVILTSGANGLGLVAEIRNAFSDAIGLGAASPVKTVSIRGGPAGDLAGRYQLDPATPMDVRRALADSFEHDQFEVMARDSGLDLSLPGESTPEPLSSLSPTQFAQVGLYVFTFEFRRDAWGRIRGVTVSMPETGSVAYYIRRS